jgi:zinc transport system substrate-binding protein
MKTKTVFYISIILFWCLFIIGMFFIPRDNDNNGPDKIKITTSFYPVYFLSKEIAGDKADVFNITPAGAEPHDYEPKAQDMARMEDSKMIVINGGGLEAWADNAKTNLKDGAIMVVAGEGLFSESEHEKDGHEGKDEHGHEGTDPHIWLDPVLVKEMANRILDGFIQIDPTNENYYKANTEDLILRLENLDNEYTKGLADCKSRDIITSHSAFGYLAAAYGLNQVSVAGLSPDEEPSVQQLAEVSEFAKDNNIKYIFFESLISPKLSETIATEVGAKTLVLNPIEGLSDQEILQGKDYFSEMQNNLTNLKTALECQ